MQGKGFENYCLLYFDLDNFKVYNDTYGFENGDKILKFTADTIKEIVNKLFPNYSFVAHIGGDDFVCINISSYENNILLCQEIIKEFDLNILNFFNEKDRNNGFAEAVDRSGNLDRFNITSISIAGLYGNFSSLSSPDEIGLLMGKIKKEVKKIKKSSFQIKKVVIQQKVSN